MKATVYLSRKLLNQLKVKETESKDLMLTHNLHNIIINGKRVGCSGHIQNVLNNKCVYVSTEKSCYQPLSDKNMVRYAASMKDYSSVSLGAKGRNQFVTNDELRARPKSKRKRRDVVWHGILASCRRCRVPCESYKCTIQAVHRL